MTAIANNTSGSYTVTATGNGFSASFSLTNALQTSSNLAPGKTAPLIISWHQPRGCAPATLDYAQGKLTLPADSTATRARG